MFVAAKTAWQFWWYLSNQSNLKKIFEGELFIKFLSTTFLQMFCKLMLNFKVIFKSMTAPDNSGQVDDPGING